MGGIKLGNLLCALKTTIIKYKIANVKTFCNKSLLQFSYSLRFLCNVFYHLHPSTPLISSRFPNNPTLFSLPLPPLLPLLPPPLLLIVIFLLLLLLLKQPIQSNYCCSYTLRYVGFCTLWQHCRPAESHTRQYLNMDRWGSHIYP